MSVLINGMEMPKSCYTCPCADLEYYDCNLMPGIRIERYKRLDDCPLVPVPPHGRLIDADALKETIEALIEKHLHGYTKSTWDFVCELRSIISNAPTIIPAEEGE